MKKLCFCLISCFLYFSLLSQPDSTLFEQIQSLDYKSAKPAIEKLKIFYTLKNKIESAKPFNDSAYILVLLKISKYEFRAQNNFAATIEAANTALTICNNQKKESLKY